MTKQTSKVATEIAKYIWARIKMIFFMIVLMIVVKEHPGWDAVFGVILALQVILSFILIMKIPDLIAKEQREKHDKTRYSHQSSHKKSKGTVFNEGAEIVKSVKILGVNLSEDNEDTIKKKYRKLAMKWHPDKFSNDTLENQDKATRNFQKLNKAYETIKKYKNIN